MGAGKSNIEGATRNEKDADYSMLKDDEVAYRSPDDEYGEDDNDDDWPLWKILDAISKTRNASCSKLVSAECLSLCIGSCNVMERELSEFEKEMARSDFVLDCPLYIVEGRRKRPLVFGGIYRAAAALSLSLRGVLVKVLDIPYNVALRKGPQFAQALEYAESRTGDFGIMAQVQLFEIARKMWLESERQRPDVKNRKHAPRVWNVPRAYSEMFGGTSLEGHKHFVLAKNSRYHKGAEVLIRTRVLRVMCRWEASGHLQWKLFDLGKVGYCDPQVVAASVKEWGIKGFGNTFGFTDKFNNSIRMQRKLTHRGRGMSYTAPAQHWVLKRRYERLSSTSSDEEEAGIEKAWSSQVVGTSVNVAKSNTDKQPRKKTKQVTSTVSIPSDVQQDDVRCLDTSPEDESSRFLREQVLALLRGSRMTGRVICQLAKEVAETNARVAKLLQLTETSKQPKKDTKRGTSTIAIPSDVQQENVRFLGTSREEENESNRFLRERLFNLLRGSRRTEKVICQLAKDVSETNERIAELLQLTEKRKMRP